MADSERTMQQAIQSNMAIFKDWKRPGKQGEDLDRLTKQIAKGGGISSTGRLVGKGINFLFHLLLARVLGASAYGLYALGYNVLGISHTFSMLGLHNGIVRFGSMYRGKADKSRLKGTLLSALAISLGSSFVTAILLFFFADLIATSVFNKLGLAKVLQLFAFSLPFYVLMAVASYTARIFRRMEYDVGVQRIFHPLTNLIIVGMSFLLGYRLLGAIYGFLISSILSAILGLYLLWKIFPELISDLKPKYELRSLLPYSLTVLLVGFSQLLLIRTDRIMLGIFGLARDVGIYNAAAITAFQATLFLVSFNAIFSPIIANLYNQGCIDHLGNLLKITTKWVFGLTLPVFLVFVLFSKQIMGLFGSEFTIGQSVLISLGAAQLINASSGSVGLILIMTGFQKIELINSVILGGLNIFLNILLIPTYGILGAALATGLSIVLINLARLLEIYHLYKIHPYKLSYWKPIMAGLVAVISWIVIRNLVEFNDWLWPAGVALFGLFYALVFILFKLDGEDKVVLQAVKRRMFKMRS